METDILSTHRIIWTLISIYPIDENESKWKKWMVKIFPLFSIVSHSSLLAATVAYIYGSTWNILCMHFVNLPLFCLGFLCSQLDWFTGIKWFLFSKSWLKFTSNVSTLCIKTMKNDQSFVNLVDICSTDKHLESYEYLMRAYETSEWLWQFYLKCMLCSFLSTLVFMTPSIYMSWSFYGNFDVKHLYHPFKVMWVFNS